MSEHRYNIRISESCVDQNPLMVERQDPDNLTRFQTRERCALEIAAYVFKCTDGYTTSFFVCLFDLILYIPSTIFVLNRDGSSWVEPVLS